MCASRPKVPDTVSQEKFTPHYLPENLRDIYFAERTGSLSLVRGKEWRRLFFDRGMLTLAESSVEPENLVPVLVEHGALTADGHGIPEGMSAIDLGGFLSSSDKVSEEALDGAARLVVERVVTGAFSWDGGSYSFEEMEVTPSAFSPDVLFTFDVFMKGIQAMANFSPLREVLLAQDRKLRMNESPFLPIQSLTFGAEQGYVLSRIDGNTRMKEVALLSPGGKEDEVIRLLFGFLVLGLVEFDPPPGEGLFSLRSLMAEYREDSKKEQDERAMVVEFLERTREQGAKQVLGVGPEAGSEAIKEAYEKLRDRFRRDRQSPRVRTELKRELGLIENRLLEGYLVLQTQAIERLTPRGPKDERAIDSGDFEKRKELVKSAAQATADENQRQAEKHFLKAKEYFKEADFFNCIQFCKLAVKYNSKEAPFFSLMGDALLKNPDSRWQRLAEESYRKALEIDPWNAEYLIALGRLYKQQGLKQRAKRHFEMALEILPKHVQAQEELRSL
jgi:tetratricopeptide (TPR) repeat protein